VNEVRLMEDEDERRWSKFLWFIDDEDDEDVVVGLIAPWGDKIERYGLCHRWYGLVTARDVFCVTIFPYCCGKIYITSLLSGIRCCN
jgi:hypothetical protein